MHAASSAVPDYQCDPNFLTITGSAFSLSCPVVKFYTATLIPAAEHMSCDTSMEQRPPEQHSYPETIKSKTTLAEWQVI